MGLINENVHRAGYSQNNKIGHSPQKRSHNWAEELRQLILAQIIIISIPQEKTRGKKIQ